MKTISFILLLSLTARSQCDSLVFENRANIASIQMNFVKSNQAFEVGCGLICAGLWVNLIAITGKNQEFMNQENYKQTMIAATIVQALGVGMVFYSHTFINRQALKVSPTKITYTFK